MYTVDDIEIFIATLNRAKYLASSIESILNQTAKVKKLVILDNNSEDETEEVVRSYAMQGVEYVRCTERGFASNFAKVRELANKSYVMIFHDDDLVHPRYIELALQALNSNENISLITTRYTEFFDDASPVFPVQIDSTWHKFDKQKDFAEFMYYQELVAMQTAIYRTKDFKEHPIDYARYGKFFDWPYLVEFAGYGNVILFKELGMFYVRRHSGQESYNTNSSLTPQQIVNWDKCFYDAMKIKVGSSEYLTYMDRYQHFVMGKREYFMSKCDQTRYTAEYIQDLMIKSGIPIKKTRKNRRYPKLLIRLMCLFVFSKKNRQYIRNKYIRRSTNE